MRPQRTRSNRARCPRRRPVPGQRSLSGTAGTCSSASNWRCFDASVSVGLSAEFPAGHETATGQRAYQEAERQGVASEVKVEEVAAHGLLAKFVREHLDERAFLGGCHESELVERCGRILVSIRICDSRPDEADQSGLLVNGSQTLKECVLSACQSLEVNEQGPGTPTERTL